MFSEEKKTERHTVEGSASGEADLPLRIAKEHSYSRLTPFRSSPGSGGRDSAFPTVVLFPERVRKREACASGAAEQMQVDERETRYDRMLKR